MKRILHLAFALGLGLSFCAQAAKPARIHPTLKVAIVGGPVLAGLWPKLSEQVTKATGIRIETVAAAPKETVVPAFAAGKADLLLIHGSDETFGLLAAGLAAPLRAWTMNEHVFVGPEDDPAHIADAPNGAEALRRIALADAPLIAFRDPGSFTIIQKLWRSTGLRPGPRQQLSDDAESPQRILESAARQGAYAVVGHIPVAFGKMPSAGMKVLFKGDPQMRRVFVAVEPGPRHPATKAQRRAARKVANYLLSPKGQAELVKADAALGGPWFFPLP
ncbi:MAG TPA: substrate-binding domain-containing protein [Rhodocyclaceae bacterium]|jgi:tungstate transport system substrate-binding protein